LIKKEFFMKNTSKLLGSALIAAITLNILLITGCDNLIGEHNGSGEGNGNGKGKGEETYYTLSSIETLRTWLKNQPANTAATPYYIALDVSNIGDTQTDGSLGAVLRANSTKYVYIDLSGNPITTIQNMAFQYVNTLVGITIPSSTNSIGTQSFSGCTSLTSVTFQGTIDFYPDIDNLFGDLADKYLAGGIGTYTRPDTASSTWTKQ
jgi:hypothetical protein